MDRVNTMKYDELTLMRFADGELDEALTLEIEKARVLDMELQSYLEVFEATRSDLIRSSVDEAIPSQIYDFIDNFTPIKKQNWLTQAVKNNPFKSSIFSAALASLVTWQGIFLGAGSAITATQFAARGIQINPDIDNAFQSNDDTSSQLRAASMNNTASNDLIEKELTRTLLESPSASSIVIKLDKSFITLTILGDFVGVDGNNCKIMQLDDQYLIACNSKLLGWKIQNL